jgi:hypothetical protein
MVLESLSVTDDLPPEDIDERETSYYHCRDNQNAYGKYLKQDERLFVNEMILKKFHHIMKL